MSEMARPTVPPNLPNVVKTAFSKAQINGDVTYYPTQVAVLTPGRIAFQLRFSPALAQKPKAPKPRQPGGKPFNPFENPSPDMLIGEVAPSHRLVLNKFAVVPEHFILVTRNFKPQTHVLERDDLAATYACIQAYREEEEGGQEQGQDLFAFFNSGPHSGASQPHRHLQLLPVSRMKDGLSGVAGGSDWRVLADNLTESDEELPFRVFTARMHPDMSAEERHRAYLELYRDAVRAVLPDAKVRDEGEAQISYNVAMTSNSLVICPRMAEGAAIKNKSGEDVGEVSLNGTVLAGTALVKNQAEWDALRENPDMLLDVLKAIGVPP
ncbi:HIT-like protein [Hypoxylon trugodes]|uniref:HIT-like protein n=1 Tax=Hypoxylon trugodes TaxID=326681 RepID=UPI0021937F0D|nr:HIT-like protein [Hypoxylon trugodes]KAI1393819.1 HIT-like protein [Hypoxylon trugodes]